MRRTVPVVAVAVLAVLAGGCGDDGSGLSGGNQPAPTVTVAPADVGFCDAFGALIAGPLTETSVDLQDPANLEIAVATTRSILAGLVSSAPPELAADAEAVAAEYAVGFEVLERYGYDFARIDAEATPVDAAVLDTFLEAPVGPGAADPVAVLEDAFLDRCAPDITVPPDLLSTTTTEP